MLKIYLLFICVLCEIKSNPYTTFSYFFIRKNFVKVNFNNIIVGGLKLNKYKYDDLFLGIYFERKISDKASIGPQICYLFNQKKLTLELKVVYKNFVFKLGSALFESKRRHNLNIFFDFGYSNDSCDLTLGCWITQTEKNLTMYQNNKKLGNEILENKKINIFNKKNYDNEKNDNFHLLNDKESDNVSLPASLLKDSLDGSFHDTFSCCSSCRSYQFEEPACKEIEDSIFKFEQKNQSYLQQGVIVYDSENKNDKNDKKEQNKNVNERYTNVKVSNFKNNSSNFRSSHVEMFNILNNNTINSYQINQINSELSANYMELQDIRRQELIIKSEICQLQECKLRFKNFNFNNIVFLSCDNLKRFKLQSFNDFDEKNIMLSLIYSKPEIKNSSSKFNFQNLCVKKVKAGQQVGKSFLTLYSQSGNILKLNNSYYIDKKTFFPLINQIRKDYEAEKFNFLICLTDKLSYYGYNFYEPSHQFDIDLYAFEIWKNLLHCSIKNNNENITLEQYIKNIHVNLMKKKLNIDDAIMKLNFLNQEINFELFENPKEHSLFIHWYNYFTQLSHNKDQKNIFINRVVNTCYNILILDCIRRSQIDQEFNILNMLNLEGCKDCKINPLIELSSKFDPVIMLPFFNLNKFDFENYKKVQNLKKTEKDDKKIFKQNVENRNRLRAYYATYKMLQNEKNNKISWLNSERIRKNKTSPLNQLNFEEKNCHSDMNEDIYSNALINLPNVSEDFQKIKQNINSFKEKTDLFLERIADFKFEDVLDRHTDKDLDENNNCLMFQTGAQSIGNFLSSKKLSEKSLKIQKNECYELGDFFHFFLACKQIETHNLPNFINYFSLYPFQDIFSKCISQIEKVRSDVYQNIYENEFEKALNQLLDLKRIIQSGKRLIGNEYVRKKNIYINDFFSKIFNSYILDLEYIYERVVYLEKLISLNNLNYNNKDAFKNLFLDTVIYPNIGIFASDIKFSSRRMKNYKITQIQECLNIRFENDVKKLSLSNKINNGFIGKDKKEIKKIKFYERHKSLLLKTVNSQMKKLNELKYYNNIEEYFQSYSNFYQRFYNIMNLYSTLKVKLVIFKKFEKFFHDFPDRNYIDLSAKIIDDFGYKDNYELLQNDLSCCLELLSHIDAYKMKSGFNMLKFLHFKGFQQIFCESNPINEINLSVTHNQGDFQNNKRLFKDFFINDLIKFKNMNDVVHKELISKFLKNNTKSDRTLINKKNSLKNHVLESNCIFKSNNKDDIDFAIICQLHLRAIEDYINKMCFYPLKEWFKTFEILQNSQQISSQIIDFLTLLSNDTHIKIIFEQSDKKDSLNESKIVCLDHLLGFVEKNKVLFPNIINTRFFKINQV